MKLFAAVMPLALLMGCQSARPVALDKDEGTFEGYQAVLLDNNQVYFGKVTGLGTEYAELTDVFYIQSAVNTETKQQSNVLLRRGKEWHAPKKMRLNNQHIIMVEPVSAGSQVAKLIAQAKGQ
jgi:hypothetical protein